MLPKNKHGLKPSARSAFGGAYGVFRKGSQKGESTYRVIVELSVSDGRGVAAWCIRLCVGNHFVGQQ